MKNDYIVVMVMCASKDEASRITDSLLKKRLIACANILGGVESRFWWKGKIDRSREILLVMKSRRGNFQKIEREVRRLHSYEVPEIIALPITQGSRAYLGWIGESLSG